MLNAGYFKRPGMMRGSLDCGGKGAADDTALVFPQRQNIWGRSTNQSGVALREQVLAPLPAALHKRGWIR